MWRTHAATCQHTFIIQLVYRLEGAEWITQKGVWRMPMSHYTALLKALPAVPGVRLDVQPLPPVAQALVKVCLLLCGHSSATLDMSTQRQNL